MPAGAVGALAAALTAGLTAGHGLVLAAPAAASEPRVVETALRVDVGPEPGGPGGAGGGPVSLDASIFTPSGAPGARPAVVLAHGYGGSKADSAAPARELAAAGYVVMTYTARGFGASGGRIHLGDPAFEGADVTALVDVLAGRDDVARDPAQDGAAVSGDAGRPDPLVGVAGASYGGAAALLAGGLDARVDAVAAAITWHDLRQALVPQSATVLGPGAPREPAPGVLKQAWVAQLLASGGPPSGPGGGDPACGRLAPDLCAAYLETVERGGGAPPGERLLALLETASPARVAAPPGRPPVPTLLLQGEADTLFGLDQSLLTARALREAGGEVAVVWSPGGHDAGAGVQDELVERARTWFDRHLATGPAPGPADDGGTGGAGAPFEYALPLPAVAALVGDDDAADDGAAADGAGSGSDDAGSGSDDAGSDDAPVAERRSLPRIPGPEAPPEGPGRTLELALAPVAAVAPPGLPVASPAGGQPAARTSLPGLGALSALPVPALAAAGVVPGQSAVFETAPLTDDLQLLGSSTVDLAVTSSAPDAVLFAALYDVDAAGRSTLPGGAVAPLRVQAPPGTPTTVRVRLPTVVLDAPAGHRLRLVVSSTDAAYALPDDARTYAVALAPAQGPAQGGEAQEGVLRLALADEGSTPVTPADRTTTLPVPQALVAGGLVAAALLLAALARLRGRRRPPAAGPSSGPTGPGGPALVVTDLTKEYADGYRAVDGVSFTVGRGQVVGLLGPNGAGKTTTLRVLLGLLRPTSGTVEVLGQPVVPGAPVLARVGALVEGPGFLPHLSGEANLRQFWRATGRPPAEAHLEEALAVADLGAAARRRVRSYSQGMRMRLGIAQAVLGLPDLLVLDEPTNGLDPPQITAMRQVLRDYAATGRTVLVSSHLLSEVEQTCSHVVVMGRGRVLAAGTVAELVGAGGADGAGSAAVAVRVAPGQRARAARVLGRLAGVAVVPGDAAAGPGGPGAGASGAGDDELLVDLEGVAAEDVVRALVRAGVPVRAVVPRRRLEEAFLALVGAEQA